MDDLKQQKDEIEVLASIYQDDWCVDNEEEGLYHINIECSHIQLILLLELPPTYPSKSPPYFELLTSSLRTSDKEALKEILQELYLENIGETIIFQWVEKIREWIQQKTDVSFDEPCTENEKKSCSVQQTFNAGDYATDEEVNRICAEMQDNVEIIEDATSEIEEDTIEPEPAEEDPIEPEPGETCHLNIIHGDPLTFKKSTFQGHAAFITDPKDAKVFLKELMKNKKVAHATHNIQAYRIYKERNNSFDEHYEDDGEKQAGHRLLHLMQMMNVRNVIVMVSRWYGGVHLGPDRFRLINNAAKEVLDKGNFIPPPEGKKKK